MMVLPGIHKNVFLVTFSPLVFDLKFSTNLLSDLLVIKLRNHLEKKQDFPMHIIDLQLNNQQIFYL